MKLNFQEKFGVRVYIMKSIVNNEKVLSPGMSLKFNLVDIIQSSDGLSIGTSEKSKLRA